MSPLVGRATRIRGLRAEDFAEVISLCERVYPESVPWKEEQLSSHLAVFPEGQVVAEDAASGRLLGLASSLIVRWDDYDFDAEWREWTAYGTFSNHDARHGRTLYGAEVMVDPAAQRQGVGKSLYGARRELALRLGLRRIRAGARLRGYHRWANRLAPEDYVDRVVRGKIRDSTLTFQLGQGFKVLTVVQGYLRNDPESLGHAAIIEWLNPEVDHRENVQVAEPRSLGAKSS